MSYLDWPNGRKIGAISGIPRCGACPVRHRSICGALDDGALGELQKISRRRFVKDGDAIFHQGDEVDYFFTIVFGAVKLSTSLTDGRQHIVDLLYPPAFHGERLEAYRLYNAHAASDVELCIYPRAPFVRFVKEHPQVEHKILEMAILELDLSRDRTLILARKNSLERVASFLLMIIDRVPEIGCGAVKDSSARLRLPFTRAEMADYLGLTLETVSRQLSVLKKRRIIELNSWRDMTVPDVKRLTDAASIEPRSKMAEAASVKFRPAIWNTRLPPLSYSGSGCT